MRRRLSSLPHTPATRASRALLPRVRCGPVGYPLALLIFIGAGVQPFVKFLLTTFAVWAPGEILRPDLRYALLMFLDVVGKWALINTN